MLGATSQRGKLDGFVVASKILPSTSAGNAQAQTIETIMPLRIFNGFLRKYVSYLTRHTTEDFCVSYREPVSISNRSGTPNGVFLRVNCTAKSFPFQGCGVEIANFDLRPYRNDRPGNQVRYSGSTVPSHTHPPGRSLPTNDHLLVVSGPAGQKLLRHEC